MIKIYTDCCMSGCAICVYDLHEAALDDYRKATDDLQQKLLIRKIPESDWPKDIRISVKARLTKSNPSVEAFTALEASLQIKKAWSSSS